MLHNMYTPPPPLATNLQQNYAPTHSTSTSTTPLRPNAGPTTLNLGPVASPNAGTDDRRVSTEHPPGYVQNAYAQEMSSAQRASLEQEEGRKGSLVQTLGLSPAAGGGAGGVLGGVGGAGGGGGAGEGLEGAWNVAKGWIGKAGTALAEGEQEVWRRINGRG